MNSLYNLDVVFLGGLFPKETEEEIASNSIGNLQSAANNLQWGFVEGISAQLDKPIKVINSLYIGSYPKRYKKMLINTYDFYQGEGLIEGVNVGFINIPLVKHLCKYLSVKPYLQKWALSNGNGNKVIIAYAMSSTFTHLLRYVKKLNAEIITCLIVPDLPQYMNLANKKSKLYTIMKNLEILVINGDMEYIDCYVLLTKHMRQALNIQVPSIVIEGISTDEFSNVNSVSQQGVKTVLYSGGLNEKYGVLDLLDAFQKLEGNDYRLILCGSGDAEKNVREASRRDKRIIFKGLLKRDEVLRLQKSSWILVNPRANNEEYTKYSFPSKIMEYMSSGTPVVAYMLDGMPEEYADYIYQVRNHKDGLFIALKEALCKEEQELRSMGHKAREFVLTQKNRYKQGEKVLKMIIRLLDERNCKAGY